MLTRICVERGSRLAPLVRIRAAGCAMYMAMKRYYCDSYQRLTGGTSRSSSSSVGPRPPGTAASEATVAFVSGAPPAGVGRPRYPEIMAVTLLHMEDYDLRCYGATCIARLAVSHDSRKISIVKLGGVDLLMEQLDRATNHEQFTEFATQAILNLSTYGPNQEYICKCAKGIGLRRMLNMVRDPQCPPSATYAAAVLSNVAQHPGNRTQIYRAELHNSVDHTYGPKQDEPVTHYDGSGSIKGRLERKMAAAAATAAVIGEAREEASGGVSSKTASNKSKRARVRFNTWFESEIGQDMTEQQRKSLRRMEGESGVHGDDNEGTHGFAKRTLSPRLVSEHVRQLNLRAIPVPYKVLADAASRNLQRTMCQPLSTLWQASSRVPTVKQMAMTASMQAGAMTLTPGVNNGPRLDLSWLAPSSRAVLRWAPMIHDIVEDDKNEAELKREGVKLKSGRKAEMYKHAPPEMTVILEPRQSPRNQVHFKSGGMMSKNKARLAVWTHIKGSKASKGLFPQYTLPNGEHAFFYEHQGTHEAIFPPEIPPSPPQDEDRFGAPMKLNEPCPVRPNWEKDPPLIRCLRAPVPPPCPTTHPGSSPSSTSPPTSSTAVSVVSSKKEAFTLKAVLGLLDSSNVISFSVAHRAQLSQQTNESQEKEARNSNGWSLENSVFAPRLTESDSFSYWDEAWVRGSSFNVDWSRALRKQSFRNLICSTHGVGRCAFASGDDVEVNSDDHTYWFPAKVTEIASGPKVNVTYSDHSIERNIVLSRVRFPGGGKPGGHGGRCRRWNSPRTEEDTILLSPEILPDVVGLNGSEIRRMRYQSGCKVTIKRNGDYYSLIAVGVPENIDILRGLVEEVEELALVRKSIKHNYKVALATFNLFRSSGTGDQFKLTANDYDMFLDQCGIVESQSSTCGRYHLDNLFQMANIRGAIMDDEDKAMHRTNSDSAIVRYEWLELLVRVAHAKYGREASGLDECVEMLFHRNIEPFLGTLGEMDNNIFRDASLYQQNIDGCFKKHLSFLIGIFTGYAGGGFRRNVSKKREVLMSSPEWLTFLRELGLLTSQFSMVEAKFCFQSSLLLVIDDVREEDRSQMMTFVSFLEAICRAADIMFVPSKEDMRNGGFSDFHTYHLHVQKNGDRQEHKEARSLRQKSADKHFLHRRHSDDQPLVDHLEAFLDLLKTRGGQRGSLIRRRRIAAWYSDRKYETTRNSAFDLPMHRKNDFETTAKSLKASKIPPKLVFVPRRPTTRKESRSSGGVEVRTRSLDRVEMT